MRPIPIGIDDFRKLREQGMEYVDKSHLVHEVLDKGSEILLLPRPRRFGKTLAMSMLRAFLEKRAEDLSLLFADLSIWQAGEAYRAHFQRYPVIALTFKDVRFDSFDHTWEAMQKKITALFEEHRAVLDGGSLDEDEAHRYRSILAGTGSSPISTPAPTPSSDCSPSRGTSRPRASPPTPARSLATGSPSPTARSARSTPPPSATG